MYKSKRFWLGLVIIIVCLVIAFQGIQLGQLFQALRQFNLIFVVPALILFWASYAPRASRWQLIFTPYRLRWRAVLSMLCIGYFLSNITPLRTGDVVRAYLVAKSEKVPVARSLSTVVVERVMDALTVVLILVVLLPVIPQIPNEARVAGLLIGIAGLVLLLVAAIISLNRERALRLMKRLTSRIRFLQREGIWRSVESLIDGFAVLHSWRPLFGIILWSLIIWCLAAVLNWTIMLAMGIHLGLDAAALVLVTTSLGVTVLPTPGQFGVFEAAATSVLVAVYNVDKTLALAFALVIHFYVYIWLMILGVFFMWREGLSYGSLQTVQADQVVDVRSPTRS